MKTCQVYCEQSANVQYSLPEAGYVVLVVYNIHGREVTELFNGYHEAGAYTMTWDAVRDDIGYTTRLQKWTPTYVKPGLSGSTFKVRG